MPRWMLCVACGLLMGCSPFATNQYHCPTEPVYDQTGTIVKHRFSVDDHCYTLMNKKIDACYRDVD